mmetsp:Transcript_46090/g.110998  ORF Transcript_46090/g.110998 Transcript_46090/m.110998 type:complete len:117 (+) Transcript_46090:630-980(+)
MSQHRRSNSGSTVQAARDQGVCVDTKPCADSILSRILQPTSTSVIATTPTPGSTPSTPINVLAGTPTSISGVQDLSLGSSGTPIKLDTGGGNIVAELVQSGEGVSNKRLFLTVSLY